MMISSKSSLSSGPVSSACWMCGGSVSNSTSMLLVMSRCSDIAPRILAERGDSRDRRPRLGYWLTCGHKKRAPYRFSRLFAKEGLLADRLEPQVLGRQQQLAL